MAREDPLFARWKRALMTGDAADAAAIFAPSAAYVDHRPAGLGEVHGRDGIATIFETFDGLSDNLEIDHEILAVQGQEVVFRHVYRFHATEELGGGQSEVVLFVRARTEGGQIQRVDVYDDEATALAGAGTPDVGRPGFEPGSDGL